MKKHIQRLKFYVGHSLNDMRVGKLRTFFVVLCIAAGVASVVSLQTLGVMIQNVLTGNLQELNRGDIRIRVNTDEDMDIGQDRGEVVITTVVRPAFTDTGINAIEGWFEERDPDVEVSFRHIFPRDFSAGFGLAKGDGLLQNVPGYIIDVQSYPPYGEIRTLDDKLIADVMREPTDIIVSDNAADKYDLKVGDQLRVGGADVLFTVRGIVDVEAEALNNFESTLLGFYYINQNAVPLYNAYDEDLSRAENNYAVEIYVKLTDDNRDTVAALVQDFKEDFPYVEPRTTKDLEEQNSQISNAIDDLTLIMGLVSLLIGGIGIIQTMMVIVSRRTTEIAILKTVGLQAQQINSLFLTESVLLGILGSVVGIPLGMLVSLALQYVGEYFLNQSLIWVFSPAAVIRGFVLGVVMTAIFGLLPTLIAGQIRPGLILRPAESKLPGAGIAQTLVALTVIFLVIGFISWTILGGGLSPKANDVLLSLIAVGLTCGLSLGIGGAAVASGSSILSKNKNEYTSRESVAAMFVWGVGLLVQTIMEGVLFFSLGIILIVLVMGNLTNMAIGITLAIGIVVGLILSVVSSRNQRSIPMGLGAVMLGFILSTLIGVIIGVVVGYPLYLILDSVAPDVWRFIVELASNIVLVEIAIILLGMIGGVLWLLISLAQYFPSFGVPDIKLSLRALSENRNRVSTTVLALVVGVLALSLIVMLTEAIQKSFAVSLEENAGGNVFIFITPGNDWQKTASTLEKTVASIDGVNSYNVATNYVVDFVEVVKADGTHLTKEDLRENINNQLASEGRRRGDMDELLDYSLNFIDGRQVTQAGALPNREFRGNDRQLMAEDAGQRVIVLTGNNAINYSGIEAGDILVFDFPTNSLNPNDRPPRMKFEVVGVSFEPLGNLSSTGSNPIYAPLDAFGDVAPDTMGAVIDIDEKNIPELRRTVAQRLPNAFVIETALLNQLVNEVIRRFTTLPVSVAILAVIIAGIVIANSVALSTMERRREFGIMKAVGIHRERILGMLLFENSLMGLLGGTIGVGASILLLIQVWAWLFDGDLRDAIPLTWALVLMGMCILISILASIFSVWRASGEKPLNVLRYE